MQAARFLANFFGLRPHRHPVLRPDPVFIVGMHRSGTSALSAALEALGLSIGKTVMNPSAEHGNPNGYYENQSIVDLHDKFLTQISREWHTPQPVPALDFQSDVARSYHEQILYVMVEEFGGSRPLIKDPRLCQLLPLWRPVVNSWFWGAVFILPIRSPMEVALSLAKRDKFTLEHGLALWAVHVLQAEKETRGLKRFFTTYEKLLADPARLVSGLTRELNLPSQSVPAAIAGRVDPALRRHTEKSLPLDQPHRDLLLAIYESLLQNGPAMETSLDCLRTEYYQKMNFGL